MAIDQTAVGHIAHGVQSSLRVHRSAELFYHSKSLRQRTAKCLLLNGLILLGSVFVAEMFLVPLLRVMVPLESSPYAPRFHAMMSGLLHVLWLYPIYCLSIVINTITYRKISRLAHTLTHQPSPPVDMTWTRFIAQLGDQIYQMLLCLFLFAQANLVYAIPVVGRVLSIVILSWLYAFYSYEPSWTLKGWSLDRQISFFENRWAYFLGFGLPSALIASLLPLFISAGAGALSFPLCIIMATVTPPPAPLPGTLLVPSRLPVFVPCQYINFLLFSLFTKRSHHRSAD